MNRAEKEAVLHCLKSMIDEEVCEECPLYGTTGTDHCEKDCVRLAINELEQEPCKDAISRQAVGEVLLKYAHSTEGKAFAEFLVSQINDLPPVNPAEKVGRWILLDKCSNSGYYCSECQKKVVKEGWSNTVKKIKYCPNCGVKMDVPDTNVGDKAESEG